MTLYLVLQGKYDPEKPVATNMTSKRMVAIDTDDEEDLGDIQWFYSPVEDKNVWGLGNEEAGWWKIIEAYECIEPTMELHENKFPVAYSLSESEFSEIIKEANNG